MQQLTETLTLSNDLRFSHASVETLSGLDFNSSYSSTLTKGLNWHEPMLLEEKKNINGLLYFE